MNALEKAYLIKELHGLVQQLDHKALSLYEVARSKKRIGDIFRLCDDPLFKTQILAFKACTQPERAADQLSSSTAYHLSFLGYFTEIPALEQALYTQPESGWAFLHQPQDGWKIWLIPAPMHPALQSEWNDLEGCAAWLLSQQQQRACLTADQAWPVPVFALKVAQILPATVKPSLSSRGRPRARINSLGSNSFSKPQVQQQKDRTPTASVETQVVSLHTTTPHTSTPLASLVFPTEIQLDHLKASVRPLAFTAASLQRLCALELQPSSEDEATYLDITLYYAPEDQWQTRQVYVVEQLNGQGQFVKYLMLLGAPIQLQARYCIEHWLIQQQRHCAAIKVLAWSELSTRFTQLDLLWDLYQKQTETVWTQQDYFPYIPAHLIHKQKLISFEEAAADFSTPVLLLQEHQKIRVIHGANRLVLAEKESAYPYLLLKRDHQLNWQNIQQVILNLPQPISVHSLYAAIHAQIIE